MDRRILNATRDGGEGRLRRFLTKFKSRDPSGSTYLPTGLGHLDRVYLQDLGGPTVILVWQDPARPGRARLALFLIGRGALVEKFAPRVLTATTVHGRPALWAEGPYLLQTRSGGWTLQRLVEGNVLLWTEGEITYRLETDQGMEEAVRIAESLAPP
ncbi:hypothetical protein [Thermoflexus hugenholtzii]